MSVRFLTRAADEPRAHALPAAEAGDALEAAVLFAEHHPSGGEIRVTVIDCETGLEQCFHVDLDDGEVGPC